MTWQRVGNVRGPKGDPGLNGRSIKGVKGDPGTDGKSIKGDPGPAGQDGVGPDERVRVSRDDPKAGFLADKLTAGNGIEIRTETDKRGERLVIDARRQLGGGGGGQAGILVYDDGVGVGFGDSVSFDGGDPVTISGGIIRVPVGSGAGGDFIPQGGPLTEDLDLAGFTLGGATSATPNNAYLKGDNGTGQNGGYAELEGGDGDGLGEPGSINAGGGYASGAGGEVTLMGGNGIEDQEGGTVILQGGQGDDGTGKGVRLTLNAGTDAGGHGKIEIRTDNDTGDALDVLTAQGDGTALWAPGGIPQGGPLTANLAAGGFGLTGTDGAGISVTTVVAANGGDGDDSYGAGFEANPGVLNVGGDFTIHGGNGSVEEGARVVAGGGSDTDPGRISITTDNATGFSGDVLTAQGDGTALWVAPAALPGSPETYTETNVVTDRAFDASASTLDEVLHVLGSLISDLRARGVVA